MDIDVISTEWDTQLEDIDPTRVSIDSLLPGESPRLGTQNDRYTRSLADLDVTLPPITVHWPSMRVIDGMHRLCASALRGEDTILVRWFKGDEKEAFVFGVHENVIHGLPLSLSERKTAAARIVVSHPHWSDRLIAVTAGLSNKTVGVIRQCSTAEIPQLNTRTGVDGRSRPLSSAGGRMVAAELLRKSPTASLREIARSAGISTATVRDVRLRLGRNEDPVPADWRHPAPEGQGAASPTETGAVGPDPPEATLCSGLPGPRAESTGNVPPACTAADSILHKLRADPALRYTDTGRLILRWLHACTLGVRALDQCGQHVPVHCAPTIARLARAQARSWLDLAQKLEQ